MSDTSHTGQSRLLSHGLDTPKFEEAAAAIKARIRRDGDKPHVSAAQQLRLVDELAGFPFGRFLLQNRGWNGFWTDYVIEHPDRGRLTGADPTGRSLTPLECEMLDRFPVVLATQQRARIFRREIQRHVSEGAVLASVPCGLMRDLLELDLEGIARIRLVGVDLDPASLELAARLAEDTGLAQFVDLHAGDAWQIPFESAFTLLTSNGLSIYELDDEKVTDLYRGFWAALTPGGVLVTSTLTPPPGDSEGLESEWDMSRIDPEALRRQRIVFGDILEAKFQAFRSTAATRAQLEQAGFESVEFRWDEARIFPTVLARKPLAS